MRRRKYHGPLQTRGIELGILVIAVSLSGGSSGAKTLPKGLAPSDWSSIQNEYQRHRRGAFPTADGGYRARGWEQEFVTRFDGRGFEVIPDEGGWRWGLQLQSYGFPGTERRVTKQAHVETKVERVSYRWDARVEEWFLNSAQGLEHGFTIADRPPGAGLLRLHLAVRGNLHGEGSGRSVRFVDGAGVAVVNYAGLRAFDSAGRELRSYMTAEGGGLRIEVEESGAIYPVTIDPLVQQAYIKASNSRQFLGFGASVAIDGDTVVVGTDNESSNATGVNGDQTDTSAAQAGAAYVFVRVGTTWSQQAYLKPINTQGGERFGHSVGISGDSIVVGAFWEGSITQGVNPDPTPVVPHPAPFAGAAYTFVRVGTDWFPEAYIKASNTKHTIGIGDNFGNSVAISGDLMAIGAPNESSNTVGINNDQTNTSEALAGAVYLFGRTAGVWSQLAYVKGPVMKSQQFGWSVAVSGNTVVVGAPLENSGSSGTAGDETDTSAPNAGAAYVYFSSGGVWGLQAYLKASNTETQDQFGWDVAISGDTVAVGAIGEDSNATGVNGDQANNAASSSGAAYVFVRSGSLWSQQAYIKASDTLANDQFGTALAVDGDTLVVGAPHHFSGQGYVFTRSGTVWSQQDLVFPSNAATNFSASVGASGTTIVACGLDSSNATGVNGDQSNTAAHNSGAAYVYLLPTPPPPPVPPNLQPTLQHFNSFTAGSPGNYRIVVHNTLVQFNGSIGPTTATITVTDPMVPGITLQPASIVADQWDCSTSTTLLLQCTTNQILTSEATSTNIDFTVDVTGAGGYLITNVATVAGGGETAAQLSDDSVPDLAIVAGVPAPDLTIVSTHTSNLTQGGTGSFFLTVTNSGPAGWGNYVAVSDSLPAGVSATAMNGDRKSVV
jgi:trimeric autotransporter adhesin